MLIKVVFLFLLLLFASVITVQDFRDRLISLWIIIAYWLICIGAVISVRNADELYSNAISTTLYFALCFLSIIAYYYFKEKRLINIIDTKIGLGDILLLPAIGLTLGALEMVLFFSMGFCLAAIAGIFLSQKGKTVPLAGIMASWHIIYLIALDALAGFCLY